MIDNRPEYLFDLEYYQNLPEEFSIDTSLFPNLLSIDIDFLNKSCQPLTKKIDLIHSSNFNCAEELSEFYNSDSVQFEMVNVVANIYDFKLINNTNVAIPYSLSIVAGMKRGEPQFVAPEVALILQNSKLLDSKPNYTHFDPFKGNYGIFSSMFTGLTGNNSYTDELGLVIGTYFLASKYDDSEIILPGPFEQDSFTQNKFLKHREKKYFKPLLDGTPRKIWGADSPIELFVLQELSRYGYHPEVQTLIFEDGSIYPNYYEMVDGENWIKGRITKTELDIFFPEQRLAIFCDSSYHRSMKKKQSANNIDDFLSKIDIKVIRIDSKDIMNTMSDYIKPIIKELNK